MVDVAGRIEVDEDELWWAPAGIKRLAPTPSVFALRQQYSSQAIHIPKKEENNVDK